MASRILIVEDDHQTADTIRLYLENDGFEVDIATDGMTGLERARLHPPALIVLDLMLPRLSGFEVCRALRKRSNVPIIMLTARTTEDDRVLGLDSGADDYVPKPFSPRELVARVRAVLRRGEHPESAGRERLCFVGLEIDLARCVVTVAGRTVSLTPAELNLLTTLARAPGRVFRREQLAARAFGEDFSGLDRTIDAHIMNLRKKIEADRASPEFVQTVFGQGYRFGGIRA
ncbi:MAG: response regulator transcription factor [Thermoanaerobaculia bacterium]|nr:response regulator transcription factor [Thermoanaerobaculia bacterium]